MGLGWCTWLVTRIIGGAPQAGFWKMLRVLGRKKNYVALRRLRSLVLLVSPKFRDNHGGRRGEREKNVIYTGSYFLHILLFTPHTVSKFGLRIVCALFVANKRVLLPQQHETRNAAAELADISSSISAADNRVATAVFCAAERLAETQHRGYGTRCASSVRHPLVHRIKSASREITPIILRRAGQPIMLTEMAVYVGCSLGSSAAGGRNR